jgi:hypothetical protein
VAVMAEKDVAKNYHDITVNYACSVEDSKGLTKFGIKWTNSNLGFGLSRATIEYLANNIAIGKTLQISYLGLIIVRNQGMSYGETYADTIDQLASIERFPGGLINAKPNSQYEITGFSQSEDQPQKRVPFAISFHTRQALPASQISPNLTGDAVPLEKHIKNRNGIAVDKQAGYYLVDYGVFITVKNQSTSNTRFCEVRSIEINGLKTDSSVPPALSRL